MEKYDLIFIVYIKNQQNYVKLLHCILSVHSHTSFNSQLIFWGCYLTKLLKGDHGGKALYF